MLEAGEPGAHGHVRQDRHPHLRAPHRHRGRDRPRRGRRPGDRHGGLGRGVLPAPAGRTPSVEEARRRGAFSSRLASRRNDRAPGCWRRSTGDTIRITNRGGAPSPRIRKPPIPVPKAGMEAVVLVDGRYAATIRFRDQPRLGAADFVAHLPSRHGDRPDHDRLRRPGRRGGAPRRAWWVSTRCYSGVSPEGKLDIVRQAETAEASTLFLGDGINDAPAMTAATVGRRLRGEQ